jgi:hypothetical protein
MAPRSNAVQIRIVPFDDGFAVEIDGERGTVAYVTREAAFEAAVAQVSVYLAAKRAIQIIIPGDG